MRTTTTRRPSRTPARRLDRRGATLILVSLLMVPMVTLAAFSLDVGWWQVGANQLQTTVDAAALAAARAKQLYPTNNTQAKVVAYANQVASVNRAFGQTITIASSDVEPIYWAPGTRTATVSNWTDANAVRVTARATPGLIFAGVTGATPPTITRSSVAWIANVNSGVCVKPWSLPYSALYDKVQALTGIASASFGGGSGMRPDLSQEQLAALTTGNYSDAARVIVLRGPTTDAALPSGAAGLSAYDGSWEGFNFSGNAGNQSFQSNIFGCDLNKVTVTQDEGATLPGGADYECWAVHALMGNTGNSCAQPTWINEVATQSVSCHYRPPAGILGLTSYNAGCFEYANSSAPGVSMYIAWGDYQGQGANGVDHRVVGTAKVLCVFRGLGAGAGGGAPITQHETCAPGGGLVPIANLPVGTMVVVIEGLTPATIGPTTDLGTTVSVDQRLILVK